MSAEEQLNEMLTALRKMASKDVVERIVAERAARGIDTALKKTLDAGTSPEGKPWLPTKKDGKRAYKGAAAKLRVKAEGNLIVTSISGGEAYGHYAAGVPERQMLPDAGATIPEIVTEAMVKASTEAFEALSK